MEPVLRWIVHVDRADGGINMARLRATKSGQIRLEGFAEMEAKLGGTQRANLAENLLKAAEPHLTQALDAQMMRHPGPLQKSLKSTGPQQTSAGGWYLAYRATTGNERPADKIKNPQKMIYLTTRQYVKEHKTKKGITIRSYVIPADDVIGKAVAASENAVVEAMQNEFDNILNGIWGE